MRWVLLLVALWGCSSAQERFDAPYAVPQRVKVSEAASQRLLVRRIEPTYPEAARQDCLQGDVVVSVVVAKNGYVKSAQALSGSVELRSAAERAVMRWKYEPYLLNDKAVEYGTQATVRFRLPEILCPPNKT